MHQYVGLSSRRSSCDLKDAQKNHFLFQKLHFSTLLKFYENPSNTTILKQLIEISASPLISIESNFAIDATGFSTSFFKRWFDEKYGKEHNRRLWKKCHIVSGVKTNIITSIQITPGSTADCPILPELLKKTSERFKVERLCADKAYLSRKNFKAIAEVEAEPYIPFKINSQGHEGFRGFWNKAYTFFMHNQEEFKEFYHQRSNVESTFSMIKRKFGMKLRSRSETSQTNEILARCLIHNLSVICHEFYELGIDIDFNLSTNQIYRQN